jgi:membrane associated rhomboid family serine protease
MLLIPLTGKNTWKNPPLVTICLILINILVFFIFQSNDTNRQVAAEKYYFESGLAEVELVKYIDYLNNGGENQTSFPDIDRLKEEKIIKLHWQMRRDKRFLSLLRRDEIVTPQDPEYTEWKAHREGYENLLSKVITNTYGFTPGAPSFITIITYMFLHGSFGHLIGNMIFLWLCGCMLEMGTSRLLYSLTYLTTGVFAAAFFWIFNLNSMIPLVGASGAIAGLMGAFSLLFGRKKIRIFFSLGFYFNYVKAPAILLLPLWIGNEIYQLFFSGESSVAYIAHIGGLISGAAISLANLKWIRAVNIDPLEDETEDMISTLVEKALTHVEKLEMDKGSKLLEDALAMDPKNKTVMVHLYNVRKLSPTSPDFHSISRKLISHLIQTTDNAENIMKTFTEYKNLAGGAKLPPDLFLKLCTLFIDTGKIKNAEGILARLLEKRPELPGLSTAVFKLAQGYKTTGFPQKHEKCLKIICSKFPGTAEAAMAKEVLSSS